MSSTQGKLRLKEQLDELPPLKTSTKDILAWQPDILTNRDMKRLNLFLRLAEHLLSEVNDRGLYDTALPPAPGTQRGSDYFTSEAAKVFSLATSLNRYTQNHGWLPDFLAPTTMTEKLLVMKMFGAIPNGPPADKLMAELFVPRQFLDLLAPVRRHWISTKPELASNDLIAPGRYYLKTNFGAGNNIPVEYPLAPQKRQQLLSVVQTWFQRFHRHGFWAGEWWYQTISPRIYLEENFAAVSEDIVDWKFWVTGGKLQIVQVDHGRSTRHIQRVYDANFELMPYTLYYDNDFQREAKPHRFEDLVKVAEAIAGPLEFARVDFFVKGDDIYLGEITLCPFGAKKRVQSPELDRLIGQGWTGTPLFPAA